MKYAPGPWKLLPLQGKYYETEIDIGGAVIGVHAPNRNGSFVLSPREIEAGADPEYIEWSHAERESDYYTALLISAAPDMAEALQRLIAVYSSSYSPKDRADCWDQARAALAKAGLSI